MFPIADLFRLRPRNIRTRLLRDLTLVILLTSGAIDWTPQLMVIVALVLLLGLLPAVSIVRKYSHQLKDVPKQLIGQRSFERDVAPDLI
jgi:hypothetical protein